MRLSSSSALFFAALIGAGNLGASGSFASPRTPPPSSIVIYSFKGGADGANPLAGLTLFNGALYGTTSLGGANGKGTVFKVSTSGNESVLYSFAGQPDAASPAASLIHVNGKLYGTTPVGGTINNGTVFEVSPSGHESVLYSFKFEPDGTNPYAGLTETNGALYGTTSGGGTKDRGTVFELSASGDESVIHSFTGEPDGESPFAGLTYLNGNLYGTTEHGGYGKKGGAGTVFEVSPSGSESVIHSFTGAHAGSSDGAWPLAGMIAVNGTLYGTTYEGGPADEGAVFSVNPAGTEKAIYGFLGGDVYLDGASPSASLTLLKGKLYGTTLYGGNNDSGTIFEVSKSGRESVVHDFQGSPADGAFPYGPLIVVNGMLYGTTANGGVNNDGTVFALAP